MSILGIALILCIILLPILANKGQKTAKRSWYLAIFLLGLGLVASLLVPFVGRRVAVRASSLEGRELQFFADGAAEAFRITFAFDLIQLSIMVSLFVLILLIRRR